MIAIACRSQLSHHICGDACVGHNNDVAKCYTVCDEHEAELFSVCNLEIQPVIDLCKSPVSEEAIVSYTECSLRATVH